MKSPNISVIQEKLPQIIEVACDKLTTRKIFINELDLQLEFINQVKSALKFDIFKQLYVQPGQSDFDIQIGSEIQMAPYNNKTFPFGPTDLVFFDDNKFETGISVELKVIGDFRNPSTHMMNTKYFKTGKHETTIITNKNVNISCIQNGIFTHHKEGQLLKDLVKTLNVMQHNSIPLSFISGLIINTKGPNQTADNIKFRIDDLIDRFLKKRNLILNNTTVTLPQLAAPVKHNTSVGSSRQTKNRKLLVFPFTVEIS